MIVKSQNPYVLSLPLLLGALYFLSRSWMLGSFLALLAAVGIHLALTLPAIPAIAIGYFLLEKPRKNVAPACAALAGALGLGCLLWIVCGSHQEVAIHGSVSNRLGDGLWGTILHFGFLVRHGPPAPWVLLVGALGLLLVLLVAPDRRWLIAALALAVIPVFAILTARGSAGYQTSRYCYQSVIVLAVAAGTAVDRVIVAPKSGTAVLLLLAGAALLYYTDQREILLRKAALLRFTPSVTREFWLGWADFFDRLPPQFRLPSFELEPTLRMEEVFAICNPRGKAGTVVLGAEHASDCAEFARKAGEIRAISPAFVKITAPPHGCAGITF